MKKACLVVQKPYQNNEIFNPTSPLNRDHCLQFFHDLKNQFAQHGVDLSTQDIHSVEASDIVVYNEMPYELPEDAKKSFVLLFESELIRPDNWNLANHSKFKRIFTWDDRFINKENYTKFNFTHAGTLEFLPFKAKTHFCTLIAGNKAVDHPLELYSKRVEAIRWFEEFHPADFQFFGMGWDLHTFITPLLSKLLNRVKPLRKFKAGKWPSYGGAVKNKLSLLKEYKFSICYENAQGIPGYITEKLFDSLSAGCMPVYWGAPNISDYVPQDCFIDRTQFKNYEDLFQYLKNMTEEEYNRRQLSISTYLKSSAHQQFEPAVNAAVVVKNILNV